MPDPDPTFNFDPYPDPTTNFACWNFILFLAFFHSNASLRCLIFLVSVIVVLICSKMKNTGTVNCHVLGKSVVYLYVWIRIRIGRPWIPDPDDNPTK
jgi:hypothetical protein